MNGTSPPGRNVRPSARRRVLELGAVLAIAVLLLTGCSSKKEVAVPNLFGMTEQEARDALSKGGLELVWVVSQNGVQTTVEKGRVLNQTPAATTSVQEGAAVDIVLAGDAGVAVPEVVGKTQGEAITEIQAAGLRVGKIEQVADAKIPVGQVIAQSPLPNEIAALGAGVDLKLSLGQPVTNVPDVVGKTKGDAEKALKDAGFTTTATEVFSDTPSGQVASQAPAGGVALSTGAAVTLGVSKGPLSVAKVPDAVGKSEADATTLLKDAGFAVGSDRAYSATVATGTVLAQTPPGGVYADKGATIEITLSDGPAPANAVTIPDVGGMTKDEATKTLEAAGLVVEVLEAYSDTAPSGQVLGQAPSKGLQTAPGATVSIAVSKGPAATTLPASTTEAS